MGFLAGKRALIAGIASNRSIAYGIAQAMHREGAELAFTYPNERMKGRVEKIREGSQIAHDISAYSFLAMAKAAKPLMAGRNGSMLTLSYLGAVASIPNYNVMGMAKASLEAGVRFMAADLGKDGIRVNCISAGPIRTLAAMGIKGFRQMLDQFANAAPLGRNVTIEEVGNAAAFLSSDLASGITAEIMYVDGGYSTVGMTGISAPEES